MSFDSFDRARIDENEQTDRPTRDQIGDRG